MSTIHLCMVKLEGYGMFVPKPPSSVPSPYHKWIIENPTIHANNSINFSIYNGRCTNNHTFIRQGIAEK